MAHHEDVHFLRYFFSDAFLWKGVHFGIRADYSGCAELVCQVIVLCNRDCCTFVITFCVDLTLFTVDLTSFVWRVQYKHTATNMLPLNFP